MNRQDNEDGQGPSRSQRDVPGSPRAVPTTGMRGGLGRTLLTAFLILTVVPLAIIGVYATKQNRENIQAEVGSKLLAIATLKGESLADWLQEIRLLEADPATAAKDLSTNSGVTDLGYRSWWEALEQRVFGLTGAVILDPDGESVWSVGECEPAADVAAARRRQNLSSDTEAVTFLDKVETGFGAVALIRPTEASPPAVLCLGADAILGRLQAGVDIGATGQVRLISRVGEDHPGVYWPSGDPAVIPEGDQGLGDASASQGAVPEYALYQNDQGDWVIGGFYPLPEMAAGVLVEQSQAEVLASTERIIATLIALILGVALVTTVAAAIVIRQITRPVIDLTESAVAMSEGNLDQRLAVRSRDEIGILTFVFNEMAAELRSFYGELEAKVVERTKRLQQANYQIQRRALHLQASQEVSQAITSIRDPDLLLARVTDLIRNHFIYSSVAVYLVDPGGGEARLQASSPTASTRSSDAAIAGSESSDDAVLDGADGANRGAIVVLGSPDEVGPWRVRCWPGDGSVVGRALRTGETHLHNEPAEATDGWYSRYQSRLAIPLKMAGRTVGVIAVITTAHEGIQRDEVEVLEGLANQVTIALENARAYERERLAMEQMETADAFKAHFLANMSRELREPLNTIIGFSRLLIKGIDGRLNDRQLEDLEQIYADSQHLLFLINDILSISQIQAGLMALRLQSVDLSELLAGVMPTASALIRGRDVVLRQELPADLPALHADPARLRQVLVHLINNAAKFTEAGEIVIRAWSNEDEVYVSVSDTGIGIPVEDRERIFMHFEKGREPKIGAHSGIGLGLALCREYVELHGGRIWVDSEVGVGSTFTFSVPVHVQEPAEAPSMSRTAD